MSTSSPQKRDSLSSKYSNPYRKGKLKFKTEDNMSTFTVLAIAAYFICCFYIFIQFQTLALNVLGLIKLICFFIGASFLVPLKLYRKRFTMSIYEYLIINIIGISPMSCALFLFFNVIFSGPTYIETYKINSFYSDRNRVYYVLENNVYSDVPNIRSIDKNKAAEFMGKDSLRIHFKDGLFGIRKIHNTTLH